MKILSRTKNFTRKTILTMVMVAAAVASVATYNNAHAADLSLATVQDCDSNAVIYCGASSLSQLQDRYFHGFAGYNGNGGKAYSIQDIYHAAPFTISPSDITNMSKYAVAGYVTKSGNVYLANGQLVATNAMTAGRSDMPGSTQVKYGATTFYERRPSVSFASNSIKAYVVMVNGTFQFAILASCGNPVMAQPKTPNYTIEKQVRTGYMGQTGWQKSVKTPQNTHVQYIMTVRSTGEVPAQNIKVRDTLPANVSYINGTLKRDGSLINAGDFFGSNGNIISSLNPNMTVTYSFEAIVGQYDNKYTCRTLVNTGIISSSGLPTKSSTASVQETCVPMPTPTPTYKPTPSPTYRPTPTPTCTPTPTPYW